MQHVSVGAADDQQGRGSHVAQHRAGQVGAAAARDQGRHLARPLRAGHECRGRARARTEQPHRQALCGSDTAQPIQRLQEALRQQVDVEHVGAPVSLFGRQQVEQQGCDSAVLQGLRDRAIARAVLAAAAAVGEYHQPGGRGRHGQITRQCQGADRHALMIRRHDMSRRSTAGFQMRTYADRNHANCAGSIQWFKPVLLDRLRSLSLALVFLV